MANQADYYQLVHEDSRTEAILKTEFIKAESTADIIGITAYSYETYDRVDFIPVLGGDGRIHAVPVPWIEYLPVMKTTRARIDFSVGNTGSNPNYHGLKIEII